MRSQPWVSKCSRRDVVTPDDLFLCTPPNGHGIELPAARDLTVVNRRPPARVAYRCGRPAAGEPPRASGRPGQLQCLVRRRPTERAPLLSRPELPKHTSPRLRAALTTTNGVALE